MDAVVSIRLENQSRPQYQVRNGETSFRLDSFGVGNIPFRLNFDPSYISNSDIYFLRAMITSGGRTIYQTQRPTYVLNAGKSDQRSVGTGSVELLAGRWELYSGGLYPLKYLPAKNCRRLPALSAAIANGDGTGSL